MVLLPYLLLLGTLRSHGAETFTNTLGMTFVKVPAGSFLMGHPGWKYTEPVHRVSLDAFFMSAYETTNAQFEAYRRHKRSDYSQGDKEPVDEVSFRQAMGFARWLSRRDGRKYSLPTEAQWEYAARGGLEGKDYPWGDEDPYSLNDQRLALVSGKRCKPVGSFAPNGYGLYDMCGNVGELVRETEYSYHSVLNQVRNPVGPTTGDLRIVRGNGVATAGMNDEVWMRLPNVTPYGVGFRLVVLGLGNKSR